MGEGSAAEARNASRYMAKYIRKAADEDRIPGMHRYEVAQDFQPKPVFLRAPSESDAVRAASRRMICSPSVQWRCFDQPDWSGPIVVWMAWER